MVSDLSKNIGGWKDLAKQRYGPVGLLPGKLGGGVRPASQIPYPICDDSALFATLFMT